MSYTYNSAKIASLSNSEKEDVLKALAAELGFILHPKSHTICIFGCEYMLAKVPMTQPFSSAQLLLFPLATSETRRG